MGSQAERYRLVEHRWFVRREVGEPGPGKPLTSATAAVGILRKIFDAEDDDRERFVVVNLDSRNRYMSHHIVSVGTSTSTLVKPSNVFGPAVRCGAYSVVVAHNHPSGIPEPSPEDTSITTALIECGRILGVPVVDSIIVGNGAHAFYSFRSVGSLRF